MTVIKKKCWYNYLLVLDHLGVWCFTKIERVDSCPNGVQVYNSVKEQKRQGMEIEAKVNKRKYVMF